MTVMKRYELKSFSYEKLNAKQFKIWGLLKCCWSFLLRIFFVKWTNLQLSSVLLKFTKKIQNLKLHFSLMKRHELKLHNCEDSLPGEISCLTESKGRRGPSLLLPTTSSCSRLRHSYATTHTRWLPYFFNHTACNYQIATG